MCGRFAYIPTSEQLKYQFQLSQELSVPARFNIAPGSSVVCLIKTDAKEAQGILLHWGLIPFWTKDRTKIRPLANARGETVFEKPAFRQIIKTKRCLMPMSGFYEWHEEEHVKQPYFFRKKNKELLAVAALWDTWQHGEEVLHSCCLLTTSANSLIQPIHHRMPVLLDKESQGLWLDNTHCDEHELISLIQPYPKNDLEGYPVSTLVNQARFDQPLAIEPLVK
jgi:putative SOS response-associated peptidase YedK